MTRAILHRSRMVEPRMTLRGLLTLPAPTPNRPNEFTPEEQAEGLEFLRFWFGLLVVTAPWIVIGAIALVVCK